MLQEEYNLKQAQKQDQTKNKANSTKTDTLKTKLSLPHIKPAASSTHLGFIQRAFPEITEKPRDFRLNAYNNFVDIYNHSRASHDLKCLSTPAKPVGGYTKRGPMNFRMWKGVDQSISESEPERFRLPPLKPPAMRLSDIINWN